MLMTRSGWVARVASMPIPRPHAATTAGSEVISTGSPRLDTASRIGSVKTSSGIAATLSMAMRVVIRSASSQGARSLMLEASLDGAVKVWRTRTHKGTVTELSIDKGRHPLRSSDLRLEAEARIWLSCSCTERRTIESWNGGRRIDGQRGISVRTAR